MDPGRFELISELFETARDLEPRERAGFLRASCAGDVELEDEVASLLGHHEADTGSLEGHGPAAKRMLAQVLTAEETGSLAPTQPGMDLPPFEIPGYRILSLLGEGGMGRVYEARQERPLRLVALKVLKPAGDSQEMRRRFAREEEAMARLQHPGIASIFEAGVVETGAGPLPYYAMERIHGLSLLDYADQHGLDVEARLRLLGEVCDAVQHAHHHGIIHRDLKPSNILVDETGQPKVLDFGVARITDSDVQLATLQTSVGQLIGTLSYMSPEQASGDPSAIDMRSDVYSLGVVAFELLGGHLPHDLTGKSIPEALRILAEEVTTHLGTIDRSLRGDVETIVSKALEPERERRYASAAALASDIRRHLSHEPIVARPPTTLYQLKKFARRNKALASGVAVAFLGLVLGLVAALRFGLREASAHEESRWQSYLANVGAAGASLGLGDHAEARRRLEQCPPDLRGWEWQHFALQSDRSVRRIHAHDERITALDLAVNGDHLMSAAWDGTVALWSTSTWERVASGATHGVIPDTWEGNRIHNATLSGDASHVLLGKERGVLRWSASGEVRSFVDEERPLRHRIFAVAHAPDDSWFATASVDPSVRIWDASSGEVQARLKGHRKAVRCLAVHPDGRRLVSGSEDGTLRIWDTVAGALLRVIHLGGTVGSVRFHPRGKTLAAGTKKGEIVLCEVETGERLGTLDHRGPVGTLAFSSDGRTLVSGSENRTLRIWRMSEDGGSATPEAVLHGHVGSVSAVAVHPDGRWVASADEAGDIRLWELGTRDGSRGLPAHDGAIHRLAFSPDGRRLVTTSQEDNTVRIWDAATAELRAIINGHTEDMAIAGSTVVTTNTWSDPGLRLYDLESAKGIGVIQGGAYCLALGPEASTTVTVGSWNTPGFRTLNVETLECRELGGSRVGRWALAWGEDGANLFIGGSHWDGGLLVQGPNGENERLDGHEDSILGMARAPFDARLVSASKDNTLRVWDTRERRCLAVLRGHEKAVTSVAVTPDGTRIVSGSEDGTARLWDLERGVPVATLRGHRSAVRAVAVSPDGARIASGDAEGRLFLWDTELEALRARWPMENALDRMAPRVAALAEEGLPLAAAEERLRADSALSTAELRLGSLFLQAREEATWPGRIWRTAIRPDRPRGEYEEAMRLAQSLAERGSPSDSDLHSQGVIEVRLERFTDALETLGRARALLSEDDRKKYAPNYEVWEALCHHHLGHRERARELLENVRSSPGHGAKVRAFLTEVEEAIAGRD